ncbi:hypothetical protein PICMEDRAFT_13089 [Pichia membranifaciens NRRL Y-2026]|uniref:Uncharacterized protein n=1 Tax=Pichia membranifaciens NRRL Y-2026 TaxID=763406 RepID=A0A1E3NGV2_9ASCO|nr:hypothetical protein PICMEDRAFT_13089 [Pichia membranifaciens NRRL Y-2026]ODQ45367.1 hypothetical protein PICMEDRAFT_13089 [Pichia membranifaciens NRRL Y-2026]
MGQFPRPTVVLVLVRFFFPLLLPLEQLTLAPKHPYAPLAANPESAPTADAAARGLEHEQFLHTKVAFGTDDAAALTAFPPAAAAAAAVAAAVAVAVATDASAVCLSPRGPISSHSAGVSSVAIDVANAAEITRRTSCHGREHLRNISLEETPPFAGNQLHRLRSVLLPDGRAFGLYVQTAQIVHRATSSTLRDNIDYRRLVSSAGLFCTFQLVKPLHLAQKILRIPNFSPAFFGGISRATSASAARDIFFHCNLVDLVLI